MYKLIAVVTVFCVVIVSFPLPAQAFVLVNCGRSEAPGNEPCTLGHLITLIMRLINYLISVSAIVAMYQILSSGFNMITAMGNSENIEKAKKGISQAVVGFGMVVLAFVFVNLLVNGVLGDPTGAVRKWWDPNCIYNITNSETAAECPKIEVGKPK